MKRTCGAKTRSGEPCKRPPMPNGRCDKHGGKSLAGIAAPGFKHGRYSKYLPDGLLERYQAARSDPDLLALRDEIALIDVRLGQLLEFATTGEHERLWPMLKEAYGELRKAIQAKDPSAMVGELGILESLINGGADRYGAWVELDRVIEQRRKLVETERKRLVEMQQMITAERAMVLVAVLQESVRKHVRDPQVLAAIASDIRRAVIAGSGVGPGGAVDDD